MESETKETSTIMCKGCGKTRTRYYAGRYPNKKDKKWVDESGREFSGLMCPICHNDNCIKNNKAKKAAKHILYE